VALAATGLVWPVGSSSASTAAVSQPTAHPSASDSYSIPGLEASAYRVTLVTGDQIQLTRGTNGHYAVSEAGASSAGPSTQSPNVRVTAGTSLDGSTNLRALPIEAANLVSTGRLDPELFDVSWLAAHGYGAASSALPLVVRYAPGSDDPASLVSRLPGTRLLANYATQRAAAVSLDLSDAPAFWAAVTGSAAGDLHPVGPPSLRGGIEAVWLGSSPTEPNRMQPADSTGSDTVTITFRGAANDDSWCENGYALCPWETSMYLAAVSGPHVGSTYQGTAACVDTNPCTELRETVHVPAGQYWATGASIFFADGIWQNVDFENPQLTVSGPTKLNFSVADAHQISIDTPKPNDSFANATQDYRIFANGEGLTNFTFTGYGAENWWLTSAADTVTAGTFYFSSLWTLGAPPVTMQVSSPEPFDLQASYPSYLPGVTMTRFTGTQTLPVVYAGTGTAQDFQGVDARGKLVLLKVKPDAGCKIYAWQLAHAKNAGADGVIFDPQDPYQTALFGNCGQPLYPAWNGAVPSGATIPWATIPLTEANQLLSMISQGTVEVRVSDSGASTYDYNLDFLETNQIPTYLAYVVSAQNLETVPTSFHGASVSTSVGVWAPQETLIPSTYTEIPSRPTDTQYYGPLSPSLVWIEQPCSTAACGPGAQTLMTFGVFDHATGSPQTWFDSPEVPGAISAWPAVYKAQPGHWTGKEAWQFCNYCRQGSTFYPIYNTISGSDPAVGVNGGYQYGSDQIQLYSNGQELTPTLEPVLSYTLPALEARYQMLTSVGSTDTEWNFTSGVPGAGQTPLGTQCVGTYLGVSSAPCQPDPLILLRYNAFTNQANAVTGSGTHQMDVDAYYQARQAPNTITTFQVWTSTNGGSSWQQDPVTSTGNGDFTVSYSVPSVAHSDGSVSLRVQASDSGGNSVSQTIYDAFGLTAGS
jgi:hypothetical protein